MGAVSLRVPSPVRTCVPSGDLATGNSDDPRAAGARTRAGGDHPGEKAVPLPHAASNMNATRGGLLAMHGG